jgi:hypothetical protein
VPQFDPLAMLRLRISDSTNLAATMANTGAAAAGFVAAFMFTGRPLAVAVAPQLAEQMITGAEKMFASLRLTEMSRCVVAWSLMTPAVQLPPCSFLKLRATGALRRLMAFTLAAHNLRRLTFAFLPSA